MKVTILRSLTLLLAALLVAGPAVAEEQAALLPVHGKLFVPGKHTDREQEGCCRGSSPAAAAAGCAHSSANERAQSRMLLPRCVCVSPCRGRVSCAGRGGAAA